MPIGTIAMILTNVGLQIYNNWCGSKQSEELMLKRNEFERAAHERNTERMWKILREGQQLTIELEKEKHNDRLKELECEIDNLLQKITYEAAIGNWPLKVLPVVMKNQAYGNLLAKQEENAENMPAEAMHIIFTRSNYNIFNKAVFPIIEKQLESFCDNHWSTVSDHPVLFYSGAWKPLFEPDDVDIETMKTALKNLPTMLITPFFRPSDGKLVFQLNIWGVGSSSVDNFDNPEIEPVYDEYHFQRTYTNQLDYTNDTELQNEIVDDVVPYLECLIGYITDTYFWSTAGLAPSLPFLVYNGTINTDGMSYLINDSREYYNKLLIESEKNMRLNPFMQDNFFSLFEGCAELWDEAHKNEILNQYIFHYCTLHSDSNFNSVNDIIKSYHFCKSDLPFLETYIKYCNDKKLNKFLLEAKEDLKNEIDSDILEQSNILLERNLAKLVDWSNQHKAAAYYRLGELYEFSIGVDYDPLEYEKYYSLAKQNNYKLAEIKYKITDGKQNKIDELDIEYLKCNNSVQSVIFLAICYYYGLGVEKSIEKAQDELEKISNCDHPYAFYFAANIVKEQYGEEQGELLVELLTRSANLGYLLAQLDLMNIYKEGIFIEENPILSARFAQKAALQGNSEALLTLAIYYLRGYGVKQNKLKALDLLSLSSERGNKDAMEILKTIKK